MSSKADFLARVGIALPIVQAPMIGPRGDLASRVAAAGGLGSVGCAASTPDQVRAQVAAIRERTDKPFNLNFFCHRPAPPDAAREAAWRERLRPFFRDFGLDPDRPVTMANRAPFDEAMRDAVVALRPPVVSFHFGLPAEALLRPLKDAGCLVLASATTVAEARWLAARGADAVIAQGAEAGGHRGMFLTDDVATQSGTFTLVPQVVDAVDVPVIAAGGIADARGVAAALALGAAAVQIGTAYLLCTDADIAPVHRAALLAAGDDDTAVTNVFTGRPARGIMNKAMRDLGPLTPLAPAFPGAAVGLQPLRTAAEASGSGDFSPLWSGQGVALARAMGAAGMSAGALTRALAGAS